METMNEPKKKLIRVESSRFITVINTIRIESNRIDHLQQKFKENNNNITVSTINKNECKWNAMNGMNESKGRYPFRCIAFMY